MLLTFGQQPEALEAALAAVDGAPHASELHSLSRGGTARIAGVMSTLRRWGYIVVKDDDRPRAAAQGTSWHLGLQQREYVRSPSAEEVVRQLLTARSAVQKEWLEATGETDTHSVMGRIRRVFRMACKVAPTKVPKEDHSYLVTFVGRKVVLALLATSRVAIDWAPQRRSPT